jgi:protein-tyrosine phosphatase
MPERTNSKTPMTLRNTLERRPARLIRADGALNFRDLGGYRTVDGRCIRWRMIYRSGTMSALTQTGLAHVESLGLRTVCDFRSTRERSREPSPLAGRSDIAYFFREHDQIAGDLRRMLRDPITTPAAVREKMCESYREIPFAYDESFRELFARLAAGDLPLVFNCAAGKDRTGVAAALLLTLLGVPRAIIIRDYIRTERILDTDRRNSVGDRKRLHAFTNEILPDVARPLLRADPAYLEAMFDSLQGHCGSVDAYLETIGVTPTRAAAIREALLAQPST